MPDTAPCPPRVVVARLRIGRSLALVPWAVAGWPAGWALWWLCLPVAADPKGLPQVLNAPVAWEFLSRAFWWAAAALALFLLGRLLVPSLGTWVGRKLPMRSREWFVAQGRARRAPRTLSVIIVVVLLAPWTLFALVAPLSANLFIASRVLAGLGMTALLLSLAGRRGRSLSCARCGYRMSSWRSAAPRCPECGSHWRDSRKIACGSRHAHRPSFAAGLGLLVLSLACLLLFGSL